MEEILMTKEEVLRRNKKAVLLIVLFLSTLLILIVGTYAWFVGFSKADVNSFTVNITTRDSLQISLDGYTWGEDLNITENIIKSHTDGGEAYADNTNHWVGEDGLVPVSTSGDNMEGKLLFFGKNSLTGTAGGFRMVSTMLDNAEEELPYYVTFDIFVKNNDDAIYDANYNLLNDENIFLTNDSSISGTASGETAFGIQNSARVAFVQLGRINIDDLEDDTTPIIKCEEPTGTETHTPLCNAYGNVYKTVIWEPNELDHETNLINYYNTNCKTRSTNFLYGTGTCTNIASGYVPTYTIKNVFLASEGVDIYDGLNGYLNDIQDDNDDFEKSLQNTKTFTDTMKETEGNYTLFKLAPHSVTKIRVYVYLEGQDVDNYDLITNDVNISVNFGFTKERINADSLNDNEPQRIKFKINTDEFFAYVPSDKLDTYTFEDYLHDVGTIDGNLICAGNICRCTGNKFIIIRPFGSGLGGNGMLDSESEDVTINTLITDGAVFTRELDPDFDGTETRRSLICGGDSLTRYTTIHWTIDDIDMSVRYERDGAKPTWETWINENVVTDNTVVKCNEYVCLVKADERVVTVTSYNSSTYGTDKILDTKGYFAEKKDIITDKMSYTTYN